MRLWPLTRSCVQDGDHISMPSYFRFLTLMAFHVFLQEKVSVFLDSVSVLGEHHMSGGASYSLCAVCSPTGGPGSGGGGHWRGF